MSVCTFIAADIPLPAVRPRQNSPRIIDINTGTIRDGGADDNYFLLPFPNVGTYTDRKYGVSLEWDYTEGRAQQILAYIRQVLHHTDEVELWHIWLLDCWEFEERPVIHHYSAYLSDLTPEDIQELDNLPIWNTPDKQHPQRPSFYCLSIKSGTSQ